MESRLGEVDFGSTCGGCDVGNSSGCLHRDNTVEVIRVDVLFPLLGEHKSSAVLIVFAFNKTQLAVGASFLFEDQRVMKLHVSVLW